MMKEESITVNVTKAKIDDLADCLELLEWSRTKDGITVAVVARVDGVVYVQIEGTSVPTVYGYLGDTILWDGFKFDVEKGSAGKA